jgi:hypothetical protein
VNATQFTFNVRNLVPGAAASFSDTVNVWAFSTGVTQGDGRPANYWKDDALTGNRIGVMDPTLAAGVSYGISAADTRALDLIGYDLAAVPEPATFGLASAALLAIATLRGTSSRSRRT